MAESTDDEGKAKTMTARLSVFTKIAVNLRSHGLGSPLTNLGSDWNASYFQNTRCFCSSSRANKWISSEWIGHNWVCGIRTETQHNNLFPVSLLTVTQEVKALQQSTHAWKSFDETSIHDQNMFLSTELANITIDNLFQEVISHCARSKFNDSYWPGMRRN